MVAARVLLGRARRTKNIPTLSPTRKSRTVFILSLLVILLRKVKKSQWGMVSRTKWERSASGRAAQGFCIFRAIVAPAKVWAVASIAGSMIAQGMIECKR